MKKLLLFLSLLVPAISFARTCSVDRYKIAAGGGASTGGT